MKILGLGNDIIEIDRIKKAIERNSEIKNRIFTKKEIEYAGESKFSYNTYAGRFAAKEAISKAFGTGIRGFSLKDIEIINNDLGKPEVFLKGDLEKKFDGYKIMLSISHSKKDAMATAILLKD
ncbi:MAG: holo-ACP synthase [Fusobacteriota bacterium]